MTTEIVNQFPEIVNHSSGVINQGYELINPLTHPGWRQLALFGGGIVLGIGKRILNAYHQSRFYQQQVRNEMQVFPLDQDKLETRSLILGAALAFAPVFVGMEAAISNQDLLWGSYALEGITDTIVSTIGFGVGQLGAFLTGKGIVYGIEHAQDKIYSNTDF